MTIIEVFEDSNKNYEYSKFKRCANEEMKEYTDKYGCHFNEALCKFAISNMTKDGLPIKFLDKDIVELLLSTYNIALDNDILYDSVYVFHMAKADFWGSSITDEEHMARYIKDVLDDTDGYEGMVFNRWYADMCKTDVEIDWESML